MTMTGSLFDVGSYIEGAVLTAGSLMQVMARVGSEFDGISFAGTKPGLFYATISKNILLKNSGTHPTLGSTLLVMPAHVANTNWLIGVGFTGSIATSGADVASPYQSYVRLTVSGNGFGSGVWRSIDTTNNYLAYPLSATADTIGQRVVSGAFIVSQADSANTNATSSGFNAQFNAGSYVIFFDGLAYSHDATQFWQISGANIHVWWIEWSGAYNSRLS